jgi:hypothetical protein
LGTTARPIFIETMRSPTVSDVLDALSEIDRRLTELRGYL